MTRRQAPPRSGPAMVGGVFGVTIRWALAAASAVLTMAGTAGGRWCRAVRSRDTAGNRRWPHVLAATVASVAAALVLVTPRLAVRVGVLNLIMATVVAWAAAGVVGWRRRRRARAAQAAAPVDGVSPWAWNALATELYETLACWMYSAGEGGMPPAEALAITGRMQPRARHRLLIVAEQVLVEPRLAPAPRAWWTAVAAGLRADLYPTEVPRSGLPRTVVPFRPRRAAAG